MKNPPTSLLGQVSAQPNLGPAGVWDFIQRPDTLTEEGRQSASELELLWALAEREALAAGEIKCGSVAAS